METPQKVLYFFGREESYKLIKDVVETRFDLVTHFNPASPFPSLAHQGDSVNLLLVEWGSLSDETLSAVKRLEGAGTLPWLMISLATEDEVKNLDGELRERIFDYIEMPPRPERVRISLRNAFAFLDKLHENSKLSLNVSQRERQIQDLNEIGISLSAERDIDRLLHMILSRSMEATSSDAGSLYIVEDKEDTSEEHEDDIEYKRLRFKLAYNYSKKIEFKEMTMDITPRSIAGYVALTGKPLNIPDAYEISQDSSYAINKEFDKKIGYRTKSMLVVPMVDHRGDMIGVVQLINRKRRRDARLESAERVAEEVIPYDHICEELISSLASQAAISLNNSMLIRNIEALLEGFVRASVLAIEARDPTTFGHSERVADLTVGLAEVVDRVDSGPYRDLKFGREGIREIRYASLLHDFGKVGVREHVLVKAKKLYDYQLELLKSRFKFIKKSVEADFNGKRVKYLLERNREEFLANLELQDREMIERIKEIDDLLNFIIESNEPAVLAKGERFDKLWGIAKRTYLDDNGEEYTYLTVDEVENLSIGKGSLNEEERAEIESHVIHTFNFLKNIPWTKELKRVPNIAQSHHEKLDGTGYPNKIGGDMIPVQSKMMAIADIFDALTAWDRPYKRAVPVERALDILNLEVKDNHIDSGLLKIFTEAELYKLVDPKKKKKAADFI